MIVVNELISVQLYYACLFYNTTAAKYLVAAVEYIWSCT